MPGSASCRWTSRSTPEARAPDADTHPDRAGDRRLTSADVRHVEWCGGHSPTLELVKRPCNPPRRETANPRRRQASPARSGGTPARSRPPSPQGEPFQGASGGLLPLRLSSLRWGRAPPHGVGIVDRPRAQTARAVATAAEPPRVSIERLADAPLVGPVTGWSCAFMAPSRGSASAMADRQ